MKKIVFGVILGVLLSSTVVYGASVIKNAYFNESIKLAVNGNATTSQAITVELEGVANGKNYFSIAEILEVLNANANLGATYSFDSKTQTVNVNVGQATRSPINQSPATTTTTTIAAARPSKPAEQLSAGMEWEWYEEGKFAEWCIKYNGNLYVHQFLLGDLGYRSTIRLNSKGVTENCIEIKDGSKSVAYSYKDTSQTVTTNISRYFNLAWIKANL